MPSQAGLESEASSSSPSLSLRLLVGYGVGDFAHSLAFTTNALFLMFFACKHYNVLAGDFHGRFETKQALHRPHHMRVMLTSNLAVDQRFANGTQGRLLHWSPPEVEGSKAVPASHPDISARLLRANKTCKVKDLI